MDALENDGNSLVKGACADALTRCELHSKRLDHLSSLCSLAHVEMSHSNWARQKSQTRFGPVHIFLVHQVDTGLGLETLAQTAFVVMKTASQLIDQFNSMSKEPRREPSQSRLALFVSFLCFYNICH